jgi:hypothetical protein
MTALDAREFVSEELGLTQLEIIINDLDERTVQYAEACVPRRRFARRRSTRSRTACA